MGVVRRGRRGWYGEGGSGNTERVEMVAREGGGRGTYVVEGGRMAWVARQCGRVARWGCEVCTVGAAAARGWGPWVHQVCRHVSVRVGVARVQLGRAGERALCGAWVKPEVGCRVYQRGLGRVGEGHGHVGEAVDA